MAQSSAVGGNYWRGLVYAAQFFFGGWFLFHGLNHWFHFFPQPPGASSVSSEVIRSLIKSGLFDWVKAVEVIAGVALLFNRFVPLAAIASFPISIVIGFLNVAVEQDANSWFVFIGIMGMNTLIAAGHLDRILPMLAPGNIAPSSVGLNRLFGFDVRHFPIASTEADGAFSDAAPKPLKLWIHIIAVVLGIGIPVALTLGTLPAPGEAGAGVQKPEANK